jgi:hydrogenase/urease accessory protein HupE
MRVLRIRVWLLLFVVLTLRTTGGEAHPLLQDRIEISIDSNQIGLLVYATLRSVVVSSGAELGEAEYFHAPDLEPHARRHAEYLLEHIQLTADSRVLVGHVDSVRVLADSRRPIHRAVDLEKIQARISLSFPTSHRPSNLTLRHECLIGFEYAPAMPWQLSYQVFLRDRLTSESHYYRILGPKELLTVDLSASAPPEPKARQTGPSLLQMARLGVLHILLGLDHLLFVSALMLGVTQIRHLWAVIGAFTVAHSTTLLLTVSHLLPVPVSVVEPLIAGSIVVAAAHAYRVQRAHASAPSVWRSLPIAFLFGLFHGLGFAGGLITALGGTIGVQVLTSILAFSVGIEVGHLVFLGSVLCLSFLLISKEYAVVCRRRASVIITLGGIVLLALAVKSSLHS